MQLAALAVAGILSGSAGLAADASAHPDGSTPLQWAVFNGNYDEAKRLIAAHADVKAINAYGVDAMQLAADASNTDMIQLLLKAISRPRKCCCAPALTWIRASVSAVRRR
jgi:ankyrin repeat protein